MSKLVTLECPKCKRTMPGCAKEDTDPPSAARVVIICNNCDDGDFHEPAFFDAEGREVPWHEGLAADDTLPSPLEPTS
jgi:hypothetical protein